MANDIANGSSAGANGSSAAAAAAAPGIPSLLLALALAGRPDASIAGLKPLTPALPGQTPAGPDQYTMPALAGLSGGLINGQ